MSHVVIVGAGPAGASLAYLLASRDIPVTLLERRRDFAREFRGEVLMPSGITAIEQMGLGAQLAALPCHSQQEISVFMNGQPLFRETLDAGADDDLRFLAVSQPALLEMLVEESSKYECFQFIRGASVKELMQEAGRISGVRVSVDDKERVLDADLVIGADGRNSIVRRQAGIATSHVSPPMDIVWCKLPLPEGWRGVRAYAGRGNLLVAYHTWDDTLQLGWVILKGTFGDIRAHGVEHWVEEMAGQVTPDFAAHIVQHRDAVQKPFLLDVVSDCVERWSVPGALLIGDAAHTMSPVGGQGINVALRDAIVSANHLVPVLGGLDPSLESIAAALEIIERERMAEIRPVQKLQAQPPKLMLSRSWWGEPLRQLMAKLISRPRIRQRAAGRVGVFFYGVTQVTLKV